MAASRSNPPLESVQAEERRFESRLWQTIYACFVLVGASPIIVLAIFVEVPWNILLGLATAGGIVFGFRRAFRIAVVVDSNGVTVSNFTRVDRLAWPEISTIELQEDLAPGGASIRCAAFVRRGSDDPVIARATFSLSTRRRLLEALQPLAKKWGVSFDVPPDVLPPD